MKISTIILGAVLIAVAVISVVSFVVLKKINIDIQRIERYDEAALVMGHFTKLLSNGDLDKAESIVTEMLRKYPDSGRTSEALIQIAGVFDEAGNNEKALYYYTICLNRYPDISEGAGIQQKTEKINSSLLHGAKFSGKDTIEYTVQPGDSLFSIARKYKTTVNYIQDLNGLKNDLIRAGQKLRVNVAEFSIYVDKKENIMILYKNGKPFKTYSIATGKNNSTPEGEFEIVDKLIKPAWTRPDGKVIQPDDPEYELGERWIPISEPGYGIHGTNNESSIGKQSTLGCVRMYNADVIELYDIVPRGTKVRIVDTAKEQKNSEPGQEEGTVARDNVSPASING